MRPRGTRTASSLAAAAALAAEARRTGRTVVFTNGVFDLLHPGHVRYLQEARALGDVLIVAINADASVRAIKGPHRPINPEHERAEVLLSLGCVDAVTIFEADTPREVIARIRPHVLVKGADWALDRIVGREEVEADGGRVVRMPVSEGYSTTDLIERVGRRPGHS